MVRLETRSSNADPVTVAEAGRLLGRSIPTVYRWLRRGRLARTRLPNDRRTYVTTASIDACIAGGSTTLEGLAAEVSRLRNQMTQLQAQFVAVAAAGQVGLQSRGSRLSLIDETYQRLEAGE